MTKKNKHLRSLILLLALGLTQCGPQRGFEGASFQPEDPTTGHRTEDGRKFVIGRETRMETEIERVAPRIPVKRTDEEISKIEFHQSLKEFRLLRYDDTSSQPSRLGESRYTFEIKVQQKNQNPKILIFSGTLEKNPQGQLHFQNTAENDRNYTLSGEISDSKPNVIAKFQLQFKDRDKVSEATILYRAYEANLNVRTPEEKNMNEHGNLLKRIENLRDNTKAWVNNFAVPFGVSTYDIAIIRKTSTENMTNEQKNLESLLEFRGRSVETGLGPSERFQVSKKDDHNDLDELIELIGNGEGEDIAIFSVIMKDDKGEPTEILVDIEREKTEEEILEELQREEELLRELYNPIQDDEDDKNQSGTIVIEEPQVQLPEETDVTPETKPEVFQEEPSIPEQNDTNIEIQLPDGDNIPVPTPRPAYTPPANNAANTGSGAGRTPPVPRTTSVGNNSKSYLIAGSNQNALKVIKDFEQHFTLRGVQTEINAIKNNKNNVNKLKSFFKFANPFRGMIETIANAYGVPPQYAYVSLIESTYFYGGKYTIQVAPGSTATGPFQILRGTGAALGMRVVGSQTLGSRPSSTDERLYFVPSACGAAEYFKRNARMFPRDSTLAVLAYNQGEGKAGQLAKKYGYNYSQIARANVAGVKYSNQKLAAYFIAGAYKGSSFDVDKQSPKQLPKNTIFPGAAIRDSVCQRATQRFR